ncbi:hypothetical protein [Xanthomonas euvesicatoria]|uniref:hypothetical protein n=1 Tax=Xanthomonas euvesicatoria TaxID=456327 RepID=UPI001C44BF31|nr:hypothetical protein [Xanthomonas euvesicatoria]MBV6851052.1 hypothetical protein [Xanthomonas campestris pv. heliotropii]MCP3042753.1 hypothetical protein [Xanthomonas euvesicatoria pv. allii]
MMTRMTIGSGVIGFKGAPYEVWNSAVFINTSKASSAEWNGLYVGVTEQIADDNVEAPGASGTGVAYVHRVSVAGSLDVYSFDDEYLGRGDIGGDEKAAYVKKVLGLDGARPLMQQLGELGVCYRGPLNEEGDVEIVIPVALAGRVQMLKVKDIRFRGFCRV